MKALKRLFGKVFSRDRRTAERLPAADLSAYYWTGAAPAHHGIRDISSTGFYLVTEERWYPGTLVMMTLQKTGDTSARLRCNRRLFAGELTASVWSLSCRTARGVEMIPRSDQAPTASPWIDSCKA